MILAGEAAEVDGVDARSFTHHPCARDRAVTFLRSIFDSVPWQERLEAISDRLGIATIRARVTQGLSIPEALNNVPEVDIL
ncbi:hypothetical protein AHiyo6_03330 [Arthrobacter sp. Hiyo6]|jgi:hypothetical protein|nr:hypothetical protein AHiyo6_03330 [Arthrobacter sp. Hiyo6]